MTGAAFYSHPAITTPASPLMAAGKLRRFSLRRFSLLLLLLAFLPEGTLGAALAKAKPKKPKAKKKPAASSGGGFGAVAPKAAQASLLQPPQWTQAVQTKGAMLVAAPEDPQLWLEMGALLVKGREYAEAERVFRLGAITHPNPNPNPKPNPNPNPDPSPDPNPYPNQVRSRILTSST